MYGISKFLTDDYLLHPGFPWVAEEYVSEKQILDFTDFETFAILYKFTYKFSDERCEKIKILTMIYERTGPNPERFAQKLPSLLPDRNVRV